MHANALATCSPLGNQHVPYSCIGLMKASSHLLSVVRLGGKSALDGMRKARTIREYNPCITS